MHKTGKRTMRTLLLDRSYWLSRPIEERFAAVQQRAGKGRPKERGARPGLAGVARLLNSTEIDYLVVGAYALAAHGLPRVTGDLDIWIESSRGNVYFLLQALNTYGFGSLDLSDSRLMEADVAIQFDQLGHPPPRIDLMTSLDGVRFADCYPRRATMALGTVLLPVIDLQDLRTNKRASGRARDLADLETLDDEVAA